MVEEGLGERVGESEAVARGEGGAERGPGRPGEAGGLGALALGLGEGDLGLERLEGPVASSSNRRVEAYAKPLATATAESASASRASAATAST